MSCTSVIAFVLALSIPGAQVSSSESTDTSLEAADSVAELDMNELILRLPPAGKEWTGERSEEGDRIDDPASDEMRRRLDDGAQLTDEQWQNALLLSKAIRAHKKWPRNEQFRVSLTVPRWLGIAQIRLVPQLPELKSTSVGELKTGFSGTGAMIDARDARAGLCLGILPEGTTEIVFDVEVERGEGFLAEYSTKPAPPPGLLWRGPITLPVELVDSFDEISEPIDNELISEAVKDAIGAGFRNWGGYDKPVPFLVIDPDLSRFPILENVGLDIKVEVLQGEKVVAETWLVAADVDTLSLIGSIHSGSERFYGSTNLDVSEVNSRTDGWVIRLTGRNEHVFILWHAEMHWSGSITIPWQDVVAHETKRTAVNPRGPEISTPYWK